MAEYRIEELAGVTGTTVRTLQSYRNRGLLPPPRREGRIALYSEVHVERLELIASLISRGYSLNAIAELLDGLGRGDRIHDLLGLEEVVGGPDEAPPAVLPLREVEALIGGGPGALADTIELGVLVPAEENYEGNPGDEPYRIAMPGIVDAAAALLAAGIPLEAILEEGFRIRHDADQIAARFVHLAIDHVIDQGAVTSTAGSSTVTELVSKLVPFAPVVVAEYVEVSLRRQIQEEIEREIGHLLDDEAAGPPEAIDPP